MSVRANHGGERLGQRIAAASVVLNAVLAAVNIVTGLRSGSTSVVAAGVEFGGDVLAAALVWAGFRIAARPADGNHPYGHGRAETVAGLTVGILLIFAGGTIAVQAVRGLGTLQVPPTSAGIWSLLFAILVKLGLMLVKFRQGRRFGSTALIADGWNDAVDLLSGGAAMVALTLTITFPDTLLAADRFGGFAVGLVVITTGLRVGRDASLQLMDTMPPAELMARIRAAACAEPGALAVEKCWARKTGLRYHVDLHLEVDPRMPVVEAHGVAERVRHRVCDAVPEVQDVLVHVEPFPGAEC